MVNRMNIGEGRQLERLHPVRSSPISSERGKETFDAVMRKEIAKHEDVRFSAHALQRLSTRNIGLSDDDKSKLANAIDCAQAKGSKDSLVLVGGAAMVVSVTNRTVVTVLDRREMQGNVFTNIDSAVIAGEL